MTKLTTQQELFCQERVNGNGISDSYLIAYPNSLRYTKNTLYNVSSKLEHNPKIILRICELKEPMEDFLEKNRVLILRKAIDIALGKDVDGKANISVLNKLLDKLIPNKSDSNIRTSQNCSLIIKDLTD